MKALSNLIQKAKKSQFQLWLLNLVMNHSVRFNKPHHFKVINITEDAVQTFAPYKKKNFNHVRGIHACAIATVGELAAGLVLMSHFSPLEYRVIMSNITIDYHYQAKKDIIATATLMPLEKEALLTFLSQSGKTSQTVITIVKDISDQLVATVKTTWQLKSWKEVRTQV